MKKQILALLIVGLSTNTFAQNFQWAKRFGGGNSTDKGQSIAVDASRNVYTTGYFQGTVDFDPGPGIFNLTCASNISSAFVSKLDVFGNFVWAKILTGTGDAKGYSIVADPLGNVYTTGSFAGTADFNPGAAINNLTSTGSDDIFISKLDASGNFVWAKNMGGTLEDLGYSIAVDAVGNVYSTGYFMGTADFDPGAAVFNLTTVSYRQIFVSKLDPSGNFVWAKRMGGTSDDIGCSIVVDASGNVYTTGWYQGTADFDPGAASYNLPSAGNYDVFISKLNVTGNFVWAKRIGGIQSEGGNSIALDALGNIYITGLFGATVDFDPGGGTSLLVSAGSLDIFVLKLDASGNFSWAKRMGGTGDETGTSVATDASGNVYTTGNFKGTADFDPGIATYNLTTAFPTSENTFISKLNSSGNFVWAGSIGGLNLGYSIAVDYLGDFYTTGYFLGIADFDPDIVTDNITSFGGTADIFISKRGAAQLPITLLSFEAAINKKDVNLIWKTATESNTDKFEIERSIDGLLFGYIGEVKASGNSNTVKSYTFLDRNAATFFPKQILYYRFKQKDLDGRITYSPIQSVNFKYAISGLQIYPNPAFDIITIKATSAQLGLVYKIADETGKSMLSGTLTSVFTAINVSILAPGIYFINVGELSKEVFKIVKH